MNGRKRGAGAAGGFSLIELVVVAAIIAVVAAVGIPQLVGARRAMRASAVPKEVRSQLRYARQAAISQGRAVTFRYDTAEREIMVVEHNAEYDLGGGETTRVGRPVLEDPAYPMTSGAVVLRRLSLVATGTKPDEIAYGRPSGVTTAALDDRTNLIAAADGFVNVTFQPDGSVIRADGTPGDYALFFYNPKAPTETAYAVSVLGAAGRIKLWRYSSATSKFVE